MRQIRLGLLEMLPVENYALADYDWFQMEEIRKGLQDGVDISVYANPAISFDRMRQVRLGLQDGINLAGYVRLDAGILRELRKALLSKINVAEYIKQGYTAEQLEQIRIALEKELNIVPYLHTEFRGVSIREICEGLEKGLDVSCYARLDFSWQQMREIRLGLENRVDISMYLNPLYEWQQMREIRLGLENGLDISSYHTLMYTAADMKRKRLKLQQEMDGGDQEIIVEKQGTFDYFSISLSADEMEAYIFVTDSSKVKREDVMKALEQSGVIYGIKEGEIDKLLKGKYKDRAVLIAEGKHSEEGPEGWYEYNFRTKLNWQPKLLPDGSVDFQSVEWFEFVKAGQILAVYHEAGYGSSGYTVTGKELPVRRGKEKSVLTGKGFMLLEDKKTYVATISGRIELKGQKIEIDKTLLMDEVSLATGNVNFDGSVMITGNVGVGSVINAAGDVFVNGFVEAANIDCRGSIFLRQGVNGNGTGFIRAGKDIEGRFFESCQVEAGGDIFASYCLNCQISAGNKLRIIGSNGMLAGGTAYAERGMEVQYIGNRVGLATRIRLGVNDAVLKRQSIIDQKIEEVNKELFIFKNAYLDFQKKYPPEIRNVMDMYLKIESAIYTKEKEMGELLQQKQQIESELKKVKNAEVIVRDTLYEGTVFEINGRHWSSSRLQNIRVKRIEDRIAVFKN